MRIVVSYRGTDYPGWATGDHLVRALVRAGHDARPYGTIHGTRDRIAGSVEDLETYKPDLLIWLECNDRDPQYTELLGLDCPAIMWDFDTEMHVDFTRALVGMRRWHNVFFANAKLARDAGVSYLPYAAPADKINEIGAIERTDEVTIIGTAFEQRVKLAGAIGAKLVCGVSPELYYRSLLSSMVTVHTYSSGGQSLLVARIFDAMACGACLLTDNHSEMLTHFVSGYHYVPYSTEHDCLRLINILKSNTKTMGLIAANGRDEVMRVHTYDVRAKEILDGTM